MDNQEIIDTAKNVLKIEAETIAEQIERIDENFARVCELVYSCQGHVVVTGLGKSGHIGGKIAATLASTGTPSFFIHPTEAGHGDIGMITKNDLLIALSYSGESHEILTMMPILKKIGVKTIVITGRSESSMAKAADICLNINIKKEACPYNLAPTSSSTTTLAICDAIAICVMNIRHFSSDDFAKSHPSGRLGKRLLTNVDDIMHKGNDIPKASANDYIKEIIPLMSSKYLGTVVICDENDKILGIYTDGDLRRSIQKNIDLNNVKMHEVMIKNPKTFLIGTRAVNALDFMHKNKISVLLITDNNEKLVGILHMHDLYRYGIA